MTAPLLTFTKSGQAGPTLILVHGVAGSLRIWDPVVSALAEQHTVVRVDLLGYGHSPKPRVTYTPREHVAAIRRTLRANGIAPPYVLVGLSMGSTLVLEWAMERPEEVRALVAIGYPYYQDRAAAKRGLAGNLWAGLTIRHPLLASVYIPTVWTLGRIGLIPARLFAGIYSQVQARETLLCPYRVFRSNIWHSMVDVDAERLIAASARLPRLFIHGQRDDWSPAEAVERAVSVSPATRFVIVPDAAHNLVVLKPTEVITLVTDFCKTLDYTLDNA